MQFEFGRIEDQVVILVRAGELRKSKRCEKTTRAYSWRIQKCS
jgi:hypothetical protein